MKRILLFLLAVGLTVACLSPAMAYTQEEIQQLVGPIALYPDPLISDVLAASTYPQEVSDAAGWVSANGALQPDQVDRALGGIDWDPSVKSLTAFPDVLNQMAGNMPWTEGLGNAFLTQPQDVYDAIQTLRQEAMSEGALTSNQYENIAYVNGALCIEPYYPDQMWVPTYNPMVLFFGVAGPYVLGWHHHYQVGNHLWFGVPDWRHHHMYFGQGYNYYYQGRGHQNPALFSRIHQDVQQHVGAWQFNAAHRVAPVPAIMPAPGRGYPTVRTPAYTHPTMPVQHSRPSYTSTPAVTPVTRFQPRVQRPPQPVVPSLFNVQPGGPVNMQRGQGAYSRNQPVPAPVRPMAPPIMTRPPSFTPMAPMPRMQAQPPRTFTPPPPRPQPKRGQER
ncbi:MAG TPA: DUF3300 domain-containing protein [Candidatus Xenobia bacterium]|jgi:hypothetical protein